MRHLFFGDHGGIASDYCPILWFWNFRPLVLDAKNDLALEGDVSQSFSMFFIWYDIVYWGFFRIPVVCFLKVFVDRYDLKLYVPISGYLLYWLSESQESRCACRYRCFAAFFRVFGCVRGIQLMDAPYSIRPIDELKRVFPILLSHFLWRRGFRWEARANTDVAVSLFSIAKFFIVCSC